jgi:hypothetical protein
MTPILATVLKVDKRGNEYVVTVQLGNDDFLGPLEKLSFENKPDPQKVADCVNPSGRASR